jgi:AcrR family transcriptional regulator
MDQTSAERRGPGRPRDPHVDEAVTAATLELLAEEGFAGLTVEHIAARAGVGKAGVYRRWPDKETVVLAALSLGERPSAPDTGSLRGDLTAFLTALVRFRAANLDAVAALSGEALVNERIGDAFRERIAAPVVEAVRGILERAVARGQLPSSADVELLATVPAAMLFTRRLLGGRQPDDAFVGRLVDQLCASAAPALAGGAPEESPR